MYGSPYTYHARVSMCLAHWYVLDIPAVITILFFVIISSLERQRVHFTQTRHTHTICFIFHRLHPHETGRFTLETNTTQKNMQNEPCSKSSTKNSYCLLVSCEFFVWFSQYSETLFWNVLNQSLYWTKQRAITTNSFHPAISWLQSEFLTLVILKHIEIYWTYFVNFSCGHLCVAVRLGWPVSLWQDHHHHSPPVWRPQLGHPDVRWTPRPRLRLKNRGSDPFSTTKKDVDEIRRKTNIKY